MMRQAPGLSSRVYWAETQAGMLDMPQEALAKNTHTYAASQLIDEWMGPKSQLTPSPLQGTDEVIPVGPHPSTYLLCGVIWGYVGVGIGG